MQGLPGSWEVHPMPLPRSTIPAGPVDLTLTADTMLPPQFRQRGHPRYLFRNSIPWLRHPLSTLQVVRCRTRMQDWLPAGGWPLPGGSRTLWTSTKGFYPLHRIFSFPRLILARRKVRLERVTRPIDLADARDPDDHGDDSGRRESSERLQGIGWGRHRTESERPGINARARALRNATNHN